MVDSTKLKNKLKRTVGVTTCVVLLSSTAIVPLYATPGDDRVERVRSEERKAASSVAAIESELSKVSAKAREDITKAQIADQDFMIAQENLDHATYKADKMKEEANKARSLVKKAQIEMSHISATLYRQGSGSVNAIEPYITANGLNDLYIRQVAVEIFGARAEAKLQTVSALEEVANVISEREEKALAEKEKATREIKKRAEEAKRTSDAATAQVQESERRRDELVQELARRRGVTLEAERQRQIEIENARRERENELARRRIEQELERQRQRHEEQARRANTPRPSSPARPAPAPAQPAAPAKKNEPLAPAVPPPPPPAPNASVAQKAISFARSQIGVPYIWGGTSASGFDCSGLVLRSFEYAGKRLPRVAAAQYNATKRVPMNQIQPGDLLFWSRGGRVYHVAIYVGGGRMIEAPRPGMSVHEVPIYYTNITPYAGRIV